MKCSSRDCLHESAVTPTLLLWAAGYPKDSHSPIECKMGVPLCRACAAHFTPRNFTTLQEGRTMISVFVQAAGRAAPDLDNAELRLDPIDAFDFPAELPAGDAGHA